MSYKFDCGKLVRDYVTGIEGIVIAQCTFLNGCVQFGIKQKAKDDGSILPTQYVDEGQLSLVAEETVSQEEKIDVTEPTFKRYAGGGPSDTPGQSCETPSIDYFEGADVLM